VRGLEAVFMYNTRLSFDQSTAIRKSLLRMKGDRINITLSSLYRVLSKCLLATLSPFHYLQLQ
jgi:hypothetical protein